MTPFTLSTFWWFVFLAIGQVVAQPTGPPAKPFNVRLLKEKKGRVICWQYPSEQRTDNLIYSYAFERVVLTWTKIKQGTVKVKENVLCADRIKRTFQNGFFKVCRLDNVCSGWVVIEGPIKDVNENKIGDYYAGIMSQGLPMAPDNLQLVEYQGKTHWISWDQPPQLGTPFMFYQYRSVHGEYNLLRWDNIRRKDGVECANPPTWARLIILKACYDHEHCSDAVTASIKDQPTPIPPGILSCIEDGEVSAPTQDPPQGPPARPFNVRLLKTERVQICWQHPSEQRTHDLIFYYRGWRSSSMSKIKHNTAKGTENVLCGIPPNDVQKGYLEACWLNVCSDLVVIEGPIKDVDESKIGDYYAGIMSQGRPMAPNLQIFKIKDKYKRTNLWLSWDQPPLQLGTPNIFYQYRSEGGDYTRLGLQAIRRKDGVECFRYVRNGPVKRIILKACYDNEGCSDGVPGEVPEEDQPTPIPPEILSCIEDGEVTAPTQDPPQVVGPTKEEVIEYISAKPEVLEIFIKRTLPLETLEKFINIMKGKEAAHSAIETENDGNNRGSVAEVGPSYSHRQESTQGVGRERESDEEGERRTKRRRTSVGQGRGGGPASPPV